MSPENEKYLSALEYEWQDENGFLWKLRERSFDEVGAKRLENLLKSIDFSGVDYIDKRLVTNLWYIVPFMEWSTETFKSISKNSNQAFILSQFAGRISKLMDNMLGIP